ncbi:MAG: hypothetical protein ACUVTH_05285 [Thermogutta sp.]
MTKKYVTFHPFEAGIAATFGRHEPTESASRECVIKLRRNPVGATIVGAYLVPALIAPLAGKRLGLGGAKRIGTMNGFGVRWLATAVIKRQHAVTLGKLNGGVTASCEKEKVVASYRTL